MPDREIEESEHGFVLSTPSLGITSLGNVI
jgi:hypothetical protein